MAHKETKTCENHVFVWTSSVLQHHMGSHNHNKIIVMYHQNPFGVSWIGHKEVEIWQFPPTTLDYGFQKSTYVDN